jgi:glutamate transport system substrate-binding protein
MQIHKLGAAVSAGVLALALAACGSDEPDETDTGTDPSVDQTDDGDGMAMPEFEEGTKMAELAEAGAIRIGIKYDQPLFGEETLEGFEGFDVEIAKLLAERLGISEDGIEFIEAVSANREPFLQQDQVDMVIATYTINETRDEVIDFAGPYYVAGQDILVPAGNPDGIEGPDDLAGLRVCSAEGSTPAQNIADNYPEAELTLFPEYSLCLDALLNGQVDALTTDNVILSGYVVQNEGEVELVGAPFTEEPYGIGVPQTDDRVFCEWVNTTLNELYEDGSWADAFAATVGTAGIETPEPPATGSCETPGAA